MHTEQTLSLKIFLLVEYGSTAKDHHTFEDSFQHERLQLALSLEETHMQESEKKINNVLSNKEQFGKKKEPFDIKNMETEIIFSENWKIKESLRK